MPVFPKPAKEWTSAEIAEDCAKAKSDFRVRRMTGTLNDYLSEFPTVEKAADDVIANLSRILAAPADQALLAGIVANPAKFTALRYLVAPPISEDDLDTLLGSSLSGTALRRNPALAGDLVKMLSISLDPKRFPWIAAGKPPTDQQLGAAKLASAVAATIARVQTKRRGDEKTALENDIRDMLNSLDWKKVPAPRTAIRVLSEGPKPGEYLQHCTLGTDNMDFVIGLRHGRTLALEAKASNSGINSRKRLNKEVVVDAQHLQLHFGAQVVAAAALRGVFKPSYVEEAQGTPLVIIWGHRLQDLQDFLSAT